MPPTPYRIAQTSSEAKKQHKKNGPRIPERQQKQLERAYELDQRAARAREAEERRKAAKKKREQREEKEERARKQIGVGLATQLVGYSHTQAQLKNGMEAFLGVSKRKAEEQRKKDAELTKKLEEIAENIEKEPWDDDEADDIVLDLPKLDVASGEQWVDNELDDDSLLELHDPVKSDPIHEPINNVQAPSAAAPPLDPTPLDPPTAKEDPDIIRVHGPINKAMEAVLDRLPEPVIELLSHDISTKLPDWDPQPGLLHRLTPVGLPPHRLRIKIGCVVTLLKDLSSSSQLSKSQHLQILRAENDRLECLVLDGQLEGTKTFLTRVAFTARYKNQEQYPFRRTQFPIRVAADYAPLRLPRDTSQSGFKLPSVHGHVRSSSLPSKPTDPTAKPHSAANQNLSFKMPGLPASKSSSSISTKRILKDKPAPPIVQPSADCWDDFLESGTQIARELATETIFPVASLSPSISIGDCLPPLSTQDLDFSLEDLEQETVLDTGIPTAPETVQDVSKTKNPLLVNKVASKAPSLDTIVAPEVETAKLASSSKVKALGGPSKQANKSRSSSASAAMSSPSLFPLSRKPPSVSDRPGLKRKAWTAPRNDSVAPRKRSYPPAAHPTRPVSVSATSNAQTSFDDFVMSTQDVASFFEDDENLVFGSPPIPT
ncbi:hypothetical protein BKA66DRAFT_467943 [Pyrenochaeta sp. MPI-SDFR-AT-0127]|nr:hypothetical protein BKA66DRAFT_467943 [Pyrenochaeta sp. MPI-SDFR-AT-0127]